MGASGEPLYEYLHHDWNIEVIEWNAAAFVEQSCCYTHTASTGEYKVAKSINRYILCLGNSCRQWWCKRSQNDGTLILAHCPKRYSKRTRMKVVCKMTVDHEVIDNVESIRRGSWVWGIKYVAIGKTQVKDRIWMVCVRYSGFWYICWEWKIIATDVLKVLCVGDVIITVVDCYSRIIIKKRIVEMDSGT